MRLKISLFVGLLLHFIAQAQVTFKITALPANTPANSKIYVAGTFNNWNPQDPASELLKTSEGFYQLTINPPAGTLKFKFTRGSWATVEGNATGSFLPDRVYNYNGQSAVLDLSVQSWEDLGGSGSGTAAPNVLLLDNDFYIPQLNRNRRVMIYLPPDYNTSVKSYPVLYMQDGQNLFDDNTSFAGEWGVDETLNLLHSQGDYGCIVVAIDNGGEYRLDEYSPWINSTYGGGQGDAYIEFIANTLKPYVDAQYRTLSGRHSTGIMGSSMGALISMYGFSERQDVFSRAGIFSPAFWFAGNEPATHVASHPKQGASRVYFLAGGQEPAYVNSDMQQVADAMTTAGFSAGEKKFEVVSNGAHSEWFWKQEFGDAYQWLFQDAVTAVTEPGYETLDWGVFPNPSCDWLRISGINTTDAYITLWGADGKIWLNETPVQPGMPLSVQSLPAGFYIAELRSGHLRKQIVVVIKE